LPAEADAAEADAAVRAARVIADVYCPAPQAPNQAHPRSSLMSLANEHLIIGLELALSTNQALSL
jgi:hypothetical protein